MRRASLKEKNIYEKHNIRAGASHTKSKGWRGGGLAMIMSGIKAIQLRFHAL
jgi:hypothetical protein